MSLQSSERGGGNRDQPVFSYKWIPMSLRRALLVSLLPLRLPDLGVPATEESKTAESWRLGPLKSSCFSRRMKFKSCCVLTA